jgi:hypothetical protein
MRYEPQEIGRQMLLGQSNSDQSEWPGLPGVIVSIMRARCSVDNAQKKIGQMRITSAHISCCE